ncbi:MAG: ABC transporter permease [Eubacterium sp.]|nr:ABC transporter permease [Eubacterium sp.]
MRAVFKREFLACFQSVVGWLFLAATLAFYYLYFYVYNMSYGYPYISYSLNAMSFLFLITVPILTMRVLAEERHAKTDQLILTAPVSVGKIVTAKYLALAAVFSAAMACISISPLLLARFGTVPYGESYTAVLGFWLYGLTCIAIGTFVSSLTESQVISAVLSFALLFIGYMMDGITQLISSGDSFLTSIMNCYNLTNGLERMSNGELDLTAVVYYISISALFLFLTTQSIQKRRWSASVKKLGLGIFHAGFAAAAVVFVVVLNLAAGALPSTITNIDCTASQLYAITDDTKNILSSLKKQVDLYVIVDEASQDEQLGTTLKKYGELSSKVKVTYMDPAVSPSFYQKYTQDRISMNSIIAVCGERSKVIDYSSIYTTSTDYQTYSTQTTGYDAEGQLTSAIQYVTNEDLQTVYEITGHGETALSGGFKESIEKMNLNLQSLNLIEAESVPEDSEAVIINGPVSDFSKDDADKIISYLNDGGKVLVTTMYMAEEMEQFMRILEAYELHLEGGIVIEASDGNFYQNPLYLLPDISYDTITAGVSDEYICAPYAQGLTYPKEEDGAVIYTELLSTSDQAFVKKDVQNMTGFDKEEGDVDGPFTVGIAVTDTKTQAQLIVYTSAAMFSDSADSIVSGNNSELFTAAVSSLAGEQQASSLIVIPVKEYTLGTLAVSQGTVMMTGLFTVIAVPAVLLLSGILIWLKRRKA